jgi:hypothetical protein
MLYLLDANSLITAHNTYYPIDRVPEFWEWLEHQGSLGVVKVPQEINEEILEGRDNDLLLNWIKMDNHRGALVLKEVVDPKIVQTVVYNGYATDLTDVEIEKLGRDPFLIAYALAGNDRFVITTENSKPSGKRQNRQIPDVCVTLKIRCEGPFYLYKLYKQLGFQTTWKTTAVPS